MPYYGALHGQSFSNMAPNHYHIAAQHTKCSIENVIDIIVIYLICKEFM